jgi:N-acyl-D-amino-acid deacylase
MHTAMMVLLSFSVTTGVNQDRDPPTTRSFDWLIAGGTVVDGTGAPGRQADVLLRDGRIAFVGAIDPDTIEVRNRFDARGLVVAPGFIDAHAHGDPVANPGFQNFLAMGVTTIVLGQDGGGPPARTLASHMDAVDAARPGVNVAYLVGHNTVRRESGVGHADDPGAGGLARMAELVALGLDAGAFGLSTGLEYDPGVRARLDELVALARPVADRGGVVMSHMRSEDEDRVEAALGELIEQGRRSGAAVHASHLKVVLGRDPARADRMLAAMARARAGGVQVTGDVYPYTASFTSLAILFPEWARPPHGYRAVVRARRAELAEHLRQRVRSRNGPEATLLGTGRWAGRTLADVARELDRPFEQVLIDLGPGGASAAYFVMDETVMRRFLQDPFVAVSSDGSPTMLHPRGHGAFARVIRRYVVEEPLLSIEEAVRKMTGLTASIVGLDDPARVDPRGRIRAGWVADLVVFDPPRVQDRAEYHDPHRLAEGMRAVWIGGRMAWRDGHPVGLAGRGSALRRRSGAGAEVPGVGAGPGAVPQRAFLARYSAYCGQAFAGRSVLTDLGEDHPLEGASLTMIVEHCDEDEVRIPFHVNEDRSRTWLLTVLPDGLRLSHDHRYEDGTEHAANLYGGFADNRGTSTVQFFPADARTIADRPAREINVWSKEFDLVNQRYYYRLYLRGELRYEAEFDLSRPLPIPERIDP